MNRLIKTLVLAFGLFLNHLNAQDYQYQSTIDWGIEMELKSRTFYSFKNIGSLCYVLTPKELGKVDELQLKTYDLDKQQIEKEWTITKSRLNEGQKDYVVLNNELYYYSGVYGRNHTISALYKYDLLTKKEKRLLKLKRGLSFSNVEIINDNLLLLHGTYPYHPGDGLAKAQLYIFNVKLNKITHQKLIDLEGISLGNIVHEWVYVNNNEIYLCSPFAGIVEKYDTELNLIESKQLNLPDVDFTESRTFAQHWDALLEESRQIFLKNKRNFSLPFYGKSNIYERMSQLRANHVYIEKIFPFDEQTFLISLYRPTENQKEFRSLFFVDKNTFKVKRTIVNWRAMPPSNEEELEQLEDYFTVDLGNSRSIQPFFYKGKIYALNYYPISLFEEGLTRKEMDLKIFRWSRENQRKFNISIFQLSE